MARLTCRFDEVAEMAVKKPKIDRLVLDFKSKDNEDQFIFVEKLEERLCQTSKQLDKIHTTITAAVPEPPEAFTQAVAKAKRSLDEGMNLITHRQKLIKLANRSEHRWKVVK